MRATRLFGGVGIAAVLLGGAANVLAAAIGTAFTYQGSLSSGGVAANGQFDLQFFLHGASSGGVPMAGPLTFNDLQVTNGLFTVKLDFGAGYISSDARWIEVAVRPGASSGAYTTLTPRQELTPAPYALGLSLPYNAFYSSPSSLFFLTQTGNGPVVQALAQGTGTGIQANITNAANASPGLAGTTNGSGNSVFGYNSGTGKAGYFQINNAANTQSALVGTTNGTGSGTQGFTTSTGYGLYGQSSGTGHAIFGYSLGTSGRAGYFRIENSGNTSNAVQAETTGGGAAVYGKAGSGYAGHFQNSNVGNSDAVLYTQNVSSGTAFYAFNSGTGRAGTFQTLNSNGTNALFVASTSNTEAACYIQNIGAAPSLEVAGVARVGILEVVGADVAERFPASEELLPGMVVAIDAANPGKLCRSRGAYNHRVAGVVSGANGLSAGTIMGNLPGSEGSPAVALTGRVWVQCDASEKAIEPGDLMTTAEREGYAMPVLEASRSSGATIGKAMTELAKGETGMVLVLVNLQ